MHTITMPMKLGSSVCGLLAVIAAFAGARGAGAQTSTFPSTPPPDLKARPFHLPAVETRTLPNGLKIVVAESHAVPMVTMRLAILAGSVLNPPDEPGLASAVASQITAGAGKYGSLALREAVDNLGGTLAVGAGEDYATLSASSLSENFKPMTELMADVILRPTFPEGELATYKQLTFQGLTVQRQNPTFLAGEEMAHLLYGSHPYSMVSTTPEAIRALTHEKLAAFYRAHYTPKDAVLIVVGDVRAAAVFAQIEKTLGAWTGSQAAPSSYPQPPTPDARHIYLIDRPGSVQSNIVFGNLAIRRNDPDIFAATIASQILTRGAGQRLFHVVREQLGYAYDVRGTLSPALLTGDFTESAQTRTEVTAPALKKMLELTDLIRNQPVAEQELQSAKNFLKGSFVIGMVTQSGLADRLLSVEVYHLPADYLQTYRDKIDAVTLADVQRAARTYFQSDKTAIVVVGDADKLREGLKEIGDVEDVK